MKWYLWFLLLFYFPGKITLAQQPGDSLFNNNVHEIRIYFSGVNYWDSLVYNKHYDDLHGTSTFIPSVVMMDAVILDSTGIQLRGHTSYDDYPTNKKPFQLSFDEYIDDQKCDGLKTIDLNNMYLDPSFTREKLFLDWLNENGMYAPRANYARLYLNDAYWGLYLMIERVNKGFCDLRFDDNDGNLFKGDHLENKCADLKYHSLVEDYYSCYELKTNNDVNDWSDLVSLTNVINNTTMDAFHDSISKHLNTDAFIANWVGYNLFADVDAYPFGYQHNYYLYHNLITDKFEWITWDVNVILGVEKSGNNDLDSIGVLYIPPPEVDKPLCKRMLENSDYKQQYLQKYCELANNTFIPSVLDSVIIQKYSIIKPDVYADTLKMFSNAQFDVSLDSDVVYLTKIIPALLPFISDRSINVLNALDALGYSECPAISGMNDVSQSKKIFAYPNPFTTSIHFNFSNWLRGPDAETDLELLITDLSGKTLLFETVSMKNEIEIGDNLIPGFYLVQVKGKNYHQVIPIVKE